MGEICEQNRKFNKITKNKTKKKKKMRKLQKKKKIDTQNICN